MDVLVVEDEKKLAEALQEGLEADHYSVQVSYSGEEGFYQVQARAFDLMILDIMLQSEVEPRLQRLPAMTFLPSSTARGSVSTGRHLGNATPLAQDRRAPVRRPLADPRRPQ